MKSTGKFKHRLSVFHHTVNGAIGIILYLGTKIFFYINVCRFDGGKPGEMYAVSRLMHLSYVFYLGCLEGNAQLLIFCWPLPQLVKIDVTTFEFNMTNYSRDITKKQFEGTVT